MAAPPFAFTSDVGSLRSGNTRFVDVPPELPDEAALVWWYAGALSFADYFAPNWDAYSWCLRELYGVAERTVVLYHRALPLAGNTKDQCTYLGILGDAVESWNPGEEHEIIAAFDPACEAEARALYSK